MNFFDTALKETSSEGKYLGSIYLALIIFFFAATWGHPFYRALALVAILLVVLTAALVSRRPDLAVAHWISTALPGCALAASLVPIIDAWRSAWAGHHVRALASLIVGCVIITVFLVTRVPRLWSPPAFRNAVVLVLFSALLIPLAHFASGLARYQLDVVATTTADAARAMWSGLNPYDLHIDAYGANLVEDVTYGGYKYLPGMPIVYGPLVLLTGARSILLTNAVLCTAIVATIFYLSRRLTGTASYFAILLFLSTPIVSEEALAEGETDVAPILLVLMAFLQWERSSFLAGLLVGLSLSMKPVPALFAATLLFPTRRAEWGRYLLGIVLGASPILPYLVWSPRNFANNIFFFNVIRPPIPRPGLIMRRSGLDMLP